MRTTPRIALLLTVALATVALAFAPATAAEGAADVVAQEEPADEPVEEAPAETESEKIQLPLDIETPYGAFGAFLLLCIFIAGALALRNASQQMRGDRPQADGSWRPR